VLGITKATTDDLKTARYESKKEVALGDNNDGVRAVELLKPDMIRLFTIIEGIKLLNSLTNGAPIASILCSSKWRTISDLAFKLREGNSGHQAVIDIYDHPEFPGGEGHTYTDLAAAAGLDSVVALASMVLRRLLGQRGVLYEDITTYPKSALCFSFSRVFFSRCSSCLTITTWWVLSRYA
jgi:hypothetical protein